MKKKKNIKKSEVVNHASQENKDQLKGKIKHINIIES